LINSIIDRIKLRAEVHDILNAETLEGQRAVWEQLRDRLWNRAVKWIMNRDTTLSFLGVPRAQRMQIELEYKDKGGVVRYVQDCLDDVLGTLPTRDNYFWRVYASGSYTPTCCPEYLERENFEALKGGLIDRISIHTDTVEGYLRKHTGEKISRFVLLDHMDWLSRRPALLASEWEAILNQAADNTRILWRSGGRSTDDYINPVPVKYQGKETTLGEILVYNREKAAQLHKRDRVHTYGCFYIADLKGGQ